MKNTQKGSTAVTLLMIIVIILLAICSYFYFKQATSTSVINAINNSQQTDTQINTQNSSGSISQLGGITFTASQVSGVAPLSVTFAASIDSTIYGKGPFVINFGSLPQNHVAVGLTGKVGSNIYTTEPQSYIYVSPGTYTATISKGGCVAPSGLDESQINNQKGSCNLGPVISSIIIIVNTPSSSTQAILQQYTDSQFPFTISYPTDFASTNNLTTAQQKMVNSYMATCPASNNGTKEPNETSFCYVGSETSDGFDEAVVSIIPSTSTTMQNCQQPESNEYPVSQTQETTLNGMNFYQTELSDAGLGHYVSGESYRTYHENVCYTIDLKIESDSGVSGKGLNTSFYNMMLTKLESILSTFTFTK